MSKRIGFAAVPLIVAATIAAGMVTLTGASAWAFTQEMMTPNGNYNFNYGPLDDNKAKLDASKNKDSSNGLQFHFDSGQQASPFGFHSFSSGGDNVPQPGTRTLNGGN